MNRCIHESILIAVAGLGLLATGCTKQAFTVTRAQTETSPGTYTIAPKVDLLMAVDDTGGMADVYSQIQNQVPNFLKQLQNKGWDYHFATTPLTTSRSMSQVAAAQFDPNWGAQWIAPFPGADPSQIESVSSLVFRTPDNYGAYIPPGDISNAKAGTEPGFETILDALSNRSPNAGFLRQDSMTVIVVVGVGDDTSRVNFCRTSGNRVVPCEDAGQPLCTSLPGLDGGGTCGSYQLSLDSYKDQLLALKGGAAAKTKFYAAISPQRGSCLGSSVFAGTRYYQMADALNGATYDICSQSVSAVLTSLSESLQVQRGTYRQHYLFLDQEPNVASIEITVTRADGTVETLSEDPYNGWTYAGYIDPSAPVYAIDAPAELNLQSGYAIELHGSGKLVGDDRADVSFKPAGAVDSVSE
jgi:hypothetical protein